MKKQWQETGWNGIELKTPSGWEPGEIGRSYLLFENDGLPVLELKWGKIKGRFSPEPVMRKLVPAKSRRQIGTFVQWTPPASWQTALVGFQVNGFAWRNSTIRATGMLLYCATCRTASLIQFFRHNDTGALDEKTPICILESFRDHGQKDRRLWSLYDIRARVPEVFDLVDFQFRTGQFLVSFRRGKQLLCLKRWSPASILLDRQDLEAFAERNIPVARNSTKMHMRVNDNVVEGTVTPETVSPAGLGWWRGLFKGKRYQRWRVWHLPEHNRILAVSLEDAQPIDKIFFNQIASAYGIIHKKAP